MIGSESEVGTLIEELEGEGIPQSDLKTIHAPIGIFKHNASPEKIAISIAAQMIKVKNNTESTLETDDFHKMNYFG